MEKSIEIIIGLLLVVLIAFVIVFYFTTAMKEVKNNKNIDNNYKTITSYIFPSLILFRKNKKGSFFMKLLFVIGIAALIVLLYSLKMYSHTNEGEKSIDKITQDINNNPAQKTECIRKCSISEEEDYETCYKECMQNEKT